jgi:phage tail tape-measure protein
MAFQAMETGVIQLGLQVTESVTNIGHFDLKSVAVQIAASIVGSELNDNVFNKITNGDIANATSNAASTITNAVLGHAVINTPINIQSIASNAIGSSIGDKIGSGISASLDQADLTDDEKPTSSRRTPAKKVVSSHDMDDAQAAANMKYLPLELI